MGKIAACVVATGLAVCVANAARAAEPFAKVRYGPTFVGFPIGVRNIGMGATGTADATGLSTGYFNPAVIAFADATTLVSSYEDMFADLGLYDAVVSSPIPFHSDSRASEWRFGGSLGYTHLDYPVQQERTIFLPEGTGRTFDPDDWMVTGSGAALWSRGVVTFSGGAAAKFIQPYPSGVDIWAFDFGAIAAFPMNAGGGRVRPRLGYAALNLDSGASYDHAEIVVPTEYRGGFGFDLQAPPVQVMGMMVPSVALALDYDRIDREGSSPVDFGAGVELSIVQMLHVRYGVIDDESTTYGVGAGWDYGGVVCRLDYAHVEPQEENWMGTEFDRDTFGLLIGVRW